MYRTVTQQLDSVNGYVLSKTTVYFDRTVGRTVHSRTVSTSFEVSLRGEIIWEHDEHEITRSQATRALYSISRGETSV